LATLPIDFVYNDSCAILNNNGFEMAIFLKKAPMNKLLLTNRTPETTSKVTGGSYWRFTWVDMATGTVYDTTVDTTMRNFPAWRDLVYTSNPYGVYTGLHLVQRNTRHNRAVVTADCVPVLVDQIAGQYEAGMLHRAIIKGNIARGSTFHNLFELE
jgi:hypothetical protein